MIKEIKSEESLSWELGYYLQDLHIVLREDVVALVERSPEEDEPVFTQVRDSLFDPFGIRNNTIAQNAMRYAIDYHIESLLKDIGSV